MADKQRVLEIISSLPENISYDEILQTLRIFRNDNAAQADIREGRLYDTESAKQRVRELAAN